MFRTIFLKLKLSKLLSNSQATFNLENVNLLSNPNVNPKNGVAYKKTCVTKEIIKFSSQLFVKLFYKAHLNRCF